MQNIRQTVGGKQFLYNLYWPISQSPKAFGGGQAARYAPQCPPCPEDQNHVEIVLATRELASYTVLALR